MSTVRLKLIFINTVDGMQDFNSQNNLTDEKIR